MHDNLMLMQRLGQSLTDYVHFMRQTLDDYNETCQLIDGSTAIHPLGLLMFRGISCTGPFDEAKQCGINDFDTDYLLSAEEVMASILHLAHDMDEEVNAPGLPAAMCTHMTALRQKIMGPRNLRVSRTFMR
jgi:hypothetical protein